MNHTAIVNRLVTQPVHHVRKMRKENEEYTVGKDIRKAIDGRDSRFFITWNRTDVVRLQARNNEAADVVTHAWQFIMRESFADDGFR